jgi:hypothetical protein
MEQTITATKTVQFLALTLKLPSVRMELVPIRHLAAVVEASSTTTLFLNKS